MVICSRHQHLAMSQKLVIVPLGDIHHNAAGFDRSKWHSVLAWIKTTAQRPDRQVLVLLMGDYLDTFSASERRGLGHAGLHETSRVRVERMLRDDVTDFICDVAPLRPYIGGVVCGNHTYKFHESGSGAWVGKTVDQVIAERLDVPFFGMCGALVLNVSRKGSNAKYPFKIFMHHGFGAAASKNASIKQVLDLRAKFPAFNLYVMGHNHIKICTTQEGIDVRYHAPTNTWRMAEVVQGFMRSASFLKGYIEGEAVDGYSGSYVEEKCLTPAGLGVVTANLRWRVNAQGEHCGFVLHVQE